MNILKKHTVARLLMICMLAGAVIWGSGRSLRKVQAETERIFFEGETPDSGSIAADIYRNWEIGADILELAEQAHGDVTSTMRELDAQLDRLSEAQEPAEILEENVVLTERVKDVQEEMDAAGVPEVLQEECQALVTELAELNHFIERDPYYDAAAGVNDALHTFPSNVLKYVSGIKEIEIP